MADVQVNNSPGGNAPQPVATGGGSGAAWAIVVIVLLAIIAWFVFDRGSTRGGDKDINVNAKIETPAPPSPANPPPTKSP